MQLRKPNTVPSAFWRQQHTGSDIRTWPGKALASRNLCWRNLHWLKWGNTTSHITYDPSTGSKATFNMPAHQKSVFQHQIHMHTYECVICTARLPRVMRCCSQSIIGWKLYVHTAGQNQIFLFLHPMRPRCSSNCSTKPHNDTIAVPQFSSCILQRRRLKADYITASRHKACPSSKAPPNAPHESGLPLPALQNANLSFLASCIPRFFARHYY